MNNIIDNKESFISVEDFPHRICLDVAHVIHKYTKNKSVCDIGCGAGDLLEYLKINNLCDKVIGIEKTNRINKNKEYLIYKDALTMDKLPHADVYIMWLGANFPYEKILKKIIGPKIIIYLEGLESNQTTFANYKGVKLIETIHYDYDETKFTNKPIDDALIKINNRWALKGKRLCGVYDYSDTVITITHPNA
jgi:hypothetical protein